jgi:hypothetical protein
MNNILYYKSARLLGIDSPEIKSKNNAEAAMARAGRDCARKLWLGKIMTADMCGMDKYGRVLVRLYPSANASASASASASANASVGVVSGGVVESVADKMLSLRIVRPYGESSDGGLNLKKESWSPVELAAGMAGASAYL